MSNLPSQFAPPSQLSVQVRYDDSDAKFANQVLVNTTAEEVFLDFSSGVITDPARGGPVLPIHSRIIMTPNGLLRLYQALGQALQNYQVVQTPATPAPVPAPAEGGNSES